MKKVLSELYFGNIQPNVKDFNRNSKFGKAMKKASENEQVLLELLDEKEKELFIEFVNAESEIVGLTGLDAFVDGFRLGANILIETITEEKLL